MARDFSVCNVITKLRRADGIYKLELWLQRIYREEIVDLKVAATYEFGAPIILHSDNGLEFRNQVVNALLFIWPSLQLVHGRSRTAITQGSVKRSNGDFQGMLGSWIRENKCSKW